MGDRRRNVALGPVKSLWKWTAKLPVKRRFQVSMRMDAPLYRLGMVVSVPVLQLEENGDSSNDLELLPNHCALRRWTSKLPVKRRFQVSLRTGAPLHRLGMPMNVPALEEGGGSSDDVEILPHHCALTELPSGSDTEASDCDEENVASGYLADSEMESRPGR